MEEHAVTRLAAALEGVAEVRLAWLFGSQARQAAGPLSDVDVAIWFGPQTAGKDRLQAGLRASAAAARALGRDDVDLAMLDDASPLLRQRVLEGGRLLVCRDRRELVTFRVRTLRSYVAARRLQEVARPYLARQLRGEQDDGVPGHPADPTG